MERNAGGRSLVWVSGDRQPGKERIDMDEMRAMAARPDVNGGESPNARPPYGPAAGEMTAYAAEVKRLSNYEVWRNVESALLALAPSQESEEARWWSLRILLDELKWRFSGLEGAGSASTRIPVNINSN